MAARFDGCYAVVRTALQLVHGLPNGCVTASIWADLLLSLLGFADGSADYLNEHGVRGTEPLCGENGRRFPDVDLLCHCEWSTAGLR